MNRIAKKEKGFTLVELMLVIAIIGILTAVSISVLKPSTFYGKGRNARRQGDLEAVRGALEQYYLDHGRQYPAANGTAAEAYNSLQTLLSDYLDQWPTDPGNNTYEYRVHEVSSVPKCYELSVDLENSEGRYETCGGTLTCQSAANFCD